MRLAAIGKKSGTFLYAPLIDFRYGTAWAGGVTIKHRKPSRPKKRPVELVHGPSRPARTDSGFFKIKVAFNDDWQLQLLTKEKKKKRNLQEPEQNAAWGPVDFPSKRLKDYFPNPS